MDHGTQLALIDRINVHRAAGRGTDTASSSLLVPTGDYTSAERLVAERELLAALPMVVGLTALVPEPGSYATVDVGDAPVVVTRKADGEVAAFLNVCRHRGAEVASGCGSASRLSCPYHGWSYELDGTLVSRRRDEYFDDRPSDGLTPVPILEAHGLLWVSADPNATITDPFHRLEAEIAPLATQPHRLFATRRLTRPINWKLAVDTFAELWHIAVLHRDTIAPLIHSDLALFDPFGCHGRLIATRKSIAELDALPRERWSLLPHSTVVWFLQPNTVLIYQQDHFELYRSRPGSGPDEAHLEVSLYVPLDSARSDDHWRKNFELLIEVTDTEDFATVAGAQRGFHTAAQEHLTVGKNEPALQHIRRSLDDLLAGRG